MSWSRKVVDPAADLVPDGPHGLDALACGVVQDPVLVPLAGPFADDPSLARQELDQCLRSLINQLDEPYQSAITAVDLDGRTHASVAAQTGLSIPGMKSRVQRARRQLRHLLTDCCDIQTSTDGTVIDYTAPPTCAAGIGCTG
jgi:DNA-directed RNA polymerase specialized sigma24 family protein